MKHDSTVVGLDVHQKTIVAAVLPPGGNRATETVMVFNHPKAVEKLVNRLAAKGSVEFVYEAGPCGYEESARDLVHISGACHLLEGNPLILLEAEFKIFGFSRPARADIGF